MASKIKVDQIQTGDGTGTIALQNQLSGMTSASMPTGSVLQVVQAVKTDRASFQTGSAFIDTGLSCSITPSSTSSKILISTDVTLSSNTTSNYGVGIRILRGSTVVVQADAQTGRMLAHSIVANGTNDDECSTVHAQYLDSPNTTSATTYKIQGSARDSVAWSINNAYDNQDSGTWFRANAVSTIILMEIAG